MFFEIFFCKKWYEYFLLIFSLYILIYLKIIFYANAQSIWNFFLEYIYNIYWNYFFLFFFFFYLLIYFEYCMYIHIYIYIYLLLFNYFELNWLNLINISINSKLINGLFNYHPIFIYWNYSFLVFFLFFFFLKWKKNIYYYRLFFFISSNFNFFFFFFYLLIYYLFF